MPEAFNQERIKEESETDEFEKERERERLSEIPLKPSKQTLINLANEV